MLPTTYLTSIFKETEKYESSISSFRNFRLLTKITRRVYRTKCTNLENTYRSSSIWWMIRLVHILLVWSMTNWGAWKKTTWWQYPHENWNNGSDNKEVIKSVNGLTLRFTISGLLWPKSIWEIITSEIIYHVSCHQMTGALWVSKSTLKNLSKFQLSQVSAWHLTPKN